MLPATKLGNIDKDLGDFAPDIRLRDLDRSAKEHENEVNFPICKVDASDTWVDIFGYIE